MFENTGFFTPFSIRENKLIEKSKATDRRAMNKQYHAEDPEAIALKTKIFDIRGSFLNRCDRQRTTCHAHTAAACKTETFLLMWLSTQRNPEDDAPFLFFSWRCAQPLYVTPWMSGLPGVMKHLSLFPTGSSCVAALLSAIIIKWANSSTVLVVRLMTILIETQECSPTAKTGEAAREEFFI